MAKRVPASKIVEHSDMKTLLILRHAKSSWKDDQLADHDRPLNKRGKRDAPRMGKLLRDQGLVPELIISSTAKRARKTAAKVAKECGYESVIELAGELYQSSVIQYVHVLRSVPAHVQCVLIVGHNPEAAALLAQLTGCETRLPTGALAHVTLDVEGSKHLTEQERGELVRVYRPKELGNS